MDYRDNQEKLYSNPIICLTMKIRLSLKDLMEFEDNRLILYRYTNSDEFSMCM